MSFYLKNSAVYTWVVLVLLTTLSWWLSLQPLSADSVNQQYTTSLLFIVAFFKVRLVVIHFMEIGTAPLFLRFVFELWIIGLLGVMLGLFWCR